MERKTWVIFFSQNGQMPRHNITRWQAEQGFGEIGIAIRHGSIQFLVLNNGYSICNKSYMTQAIYVIVFIFPYKIPDSGWLVLQNKNTYIFY